MSLDLPLIWAGLIAAAVLLYVVLDGFDLGIGILFPFAKSPGERDVMMNTIAQGLILGGFIQGVTVRDERFAGGQFDWLTPYSLLVAAGLMAGYALLGGAWLMMKTKDSLHGDARRWTRIAGAVTALLLAAVSVATLMVHQRIGLRWGVDVSEMLIQWDMLAPRLMIPLLGLAGLTLVFLGAKRGSHRRPFAGALLVFLSGYLGLAVSFAPYIAPYALNFRQAAAPDNALGLMLVGTAVILPLILAYTAWVYWVFRGKIDEESGYHH